VSFFVILDKIYGFFPIIPTIDPKNF